MRALYQKVQRTIRRHGLCPPGSRVLVGLSGGSDSVALTLLLSELAPNEGFVVAGLAHLNHGLRPTADRDQEFCRALAVRLGLPITVGNADVQALARRDGLSVEDAARRLRYDFLRDTGAKVDAGCIAVGHTEDDQAETLVLKLIRGAGLSGLAGIYPRRDRVVRPLLGVSRRVLREYLRARQCEWIEDETNTDLDNPRNRVRHRVLPELDRALGGAARPAIARTAELAREDGVWLDQLAIERAAGLVNQRGQWVEIDIDGLSREPPPIQRRILLFALRMVAGGREISLEHVESTIDMLEGRSRAADVPGSRVELRTGKLVLLLEAGLRPGDDDTLGSVMGGGI